MQKNFLKRLSIITLLLVSQFIVSQNSQEDPNLQAGYQAHGALKLEEAQTYFLSVTNNLDANNKDRCKALRELAIIDWKHYRDYEKAKKRLLLADSIGDYRSETWLNILRVEVESQNYKKAFEAGERAVSLSVSQADKNYSKYKYCKAILDQALEQITNENPINHVLLNKAALLLKEVLQTNPTHVNAADILLGISLVQEDAATALKAWLAYYRFSNPENAYAYLKPAAKQLGQLLTKWELQALSNADKKHLVEALGASRFYNYAKIIAKRSNLKSLPILDYVDYAEDVRDRTNEYYRQVSIGNANSDAFLDSINAQSAILYNKLIDKNAEAYSLNNFRALIRPKFGTFMLIARSSASSQTGLVFGHIVNERTRTIEQYGHKADFAFTELDMMVSNGYPSWFLEDRGAGGYALRGGFLRIKTMFKFLAIDAWQRVTDTVRRNKIEAEIETNLLQSNLNTDIKVIRAAVSKKINLDALDALYNSLKAQGFSGLELQLKFIEQYELLRDNATMFAHEGRHSIDRVVLGQDNYRALGSAVIEFRGRLSQIAFSESPKLEVANMLAGVSSTPTGQSNKMILDVFEAWILKHHDQIIDYNSNQLTLANLYKLTDAQIKSCIQEVDPFYKDYKNKKN